MIVIYTWFLITLKKKEEVKKEGLNNRHILIATS
jgi:hypothetical protein